MIITCSEERMAWSLLGRCEIIARVYLVYEDFFATVTLHGCDQCLKVDLCLEQERRYSERLPIYIECSLSSELPRFVV